MHDNKNDIKKIQARARFTVYDYFQKYKKLEGFLKKVVPRPGTDCFAGHILSEYVRNYLTTKEETIVIDHLRGCPRCATVVMIYRRKDRIWDQAYKIDPEAFLALLCGKIIINLRRQQK